MKREREKEKGGGEDKSTEMHKSGYLIAEDLNLTVAAMGRRRVRVRGGRLLVCVDLDMQRQTLHAFLTREIGTETLHRDVYLRIRNRTGSSDGSGGGAHRNCFINVSAKWPRNRMRERYDICA